MVGPDVGVMVGDDDGAAVGAAVGDEEGVFVVMGGLSRTFWIEASKMPSSVDAVATLQSV